MKSIISSKNPMRVSKIDHATREVIRQAAWDSTVGAGNYRALPRMSDIQYLERIVLKHSASDEELAAFTHDFYVNAQEMEQP
jgi:hypothetical protein